MTPFQSGLLEWYARNGRDLPWRREPEPYHVWLSEIIMQQTRISQGMAYWQRFVDEWPSIDVLAHASEQQVMRMWQGLGYYSRARNLHRAAQMVAERGEFPSTYAGLLTLPGVGPYTAAAIASICFGEPCAVVDGNVFRVLSRLYSVDMPIDTTEGRKLFHALAQDALPAGCPGDWNQAMMDFGAMVCTPQNPQCDLCPLSNSCLALAQDRVAVLPVKQGKVKVRHRHLIYILLECNDCWAFHQRPAGDIWQGLWEPYLIEVPFEEEGSMKGSNKLPRWAEDAVLIQRGVKHVLTHQVLYADLYVVNTSNPTCLPPGYVWLRRNEIDQYGLPRLIEKLMQIFL